MPSQPFPGLSSKVTRSRIMARHPKSFGRLTGMKALITGGDSGVGRAAAIAYALEGADVEINYLPEEPDAKEVVARSKRKAERVAHSAGHA